jgi:glycosyltransferase involved in cell wall biosynthesis
VLSALKMLGNLQSDGAQRRAVGASVPTGEARSSTCGRRVRICIVGLGSISQNPRVVKEADALAAAGYDVIVLFPQQYEWARDMDRQIMERVKWRTDVVEVLPTFGGRIRRFTLALRLHLFRLLCHCTMHFPVAELGYSRYFLSLLWRAIRHRGDLYIGHYPGSLPVVAWAARLTGAKFAFDFEDFHRGEGYPIEPESLPNRLLVAIEDRYLPGASFVTAASWGISDEVAKTTGLPLPTTVLNAFPWSDRARLVLPIPRLPNRHLSLYWFSQIVSMDRGLQDVIGAMALMREQAELHIRGADSAGSIERLRHLAEERGISERVHFHPIVPPEDLLASAAMHDVGLCLEVPATPARNVCITNKIFVYMLAGLAIAATRTRGHVDVLNRAPEIGVLYDSGDIASLATILDRYATDRSLLTRTKAAALATVCEVWNWERESKTVVGAIDRLFSKNPGRAEVIATRR